MTRLELAENILPCCEPLAVALKTEKYFGWIYDAPQIRDAVARWRAGTLADGHYQSTTKEGKPYTIDSPTRIGVVPHRNGAVRMFAPDLDNHDGGTDTTKYMDALIRFFGAQPVIFTSKSGRGFRLIYMLKDAVPVGDFIKRMRGWGFNRTNRIELFPKTEKQSQFWLPNDPNDNGGDKYITGDFSAATVAFPDALPCQLTNAGLDFLLGFVGNGTAGHNAMFSVSAELGEKRVPRETASAIVLRAAALNGKDNQQEITKAIRDGYDKGAEKVVTLSQRQRKKKEPRAVVAPIAIPTPTECKNIHDSEFYYDKNRKEYLLENRRGWLSLFEGQFKKELAARGYSQNRGRDENLSQVDQKLIQVRNDFDIDFSGPLAGYMRGYHEVCGNRIVVTESPTIIEPVAGTWSTLEQLLNGMFLTEGEGQRIVLYGWIKVSFETLQAHGTRPGQALAMCGPHECGKSLFQKLLTVVLGGRSAKPYRYMTDATDFNADLFGAESLVIEDEPTTTDLRIRRAFGAQIKQICACDTQRCHGKHRQAVTLSPFWRLTISLNDEPENLLVLPPLDDSVEDKLILLKIAKNPMPMPTETQEQREEFWAALVADLPAFLHFLCSWEIPVEYRSQRYGVRHYHHPDILEELDCMAPEYRLLSLIDRVLFGGFEVGGVVITAQELETRLTTDPACQHEARKLLSWSNATGTYLGRLAKKIPQRVKTRRTDHDRAWAIQPRS